MKTYLKQRYKSYVGLAIGIIIGFIVVKLLYDKPDYKPSIIAVSIGLIIGELFVFFRWTRERKKNKRI